jgi:hypothetical protein
MTMTQFAPALHHDLFCVHGSPRVIMSDRDPGIDNVFIRQLETLQGVSHRFTVAYRPQGNGQAEAINKEIIAKLRMYCSDPSRAQDWDSTVLSAAWAYYNTIHTAHGYTRFFLTHEYHPSSLYTLYWPATQPSFPSSGIPAEVNDFRQHHAECLDLARRHLTDDAAHRVQRHAASVHRLPAFEIGDLVRISTVHLPEIPSTPSSPLSTSAPLSFLVTPHQTCTRSTSEPSSRTPKTMSTWTPYAPISNRVLLVAFARMNQDYQPSEVWDPKLRLRAWWAASEVGASQGQIGDPTTSIEFISKTGIRSTICG